SFAVQGANPVSLSGYVNGRLVVSAADSSASALTAPGSAGIAATYAGIWFDNFTLSGATTSGGGSDGGVTDGGTMDGGTMDGGIIDGGTIDGGIIDGGTIDGGSDWPIYRHDSSGGSDSPDPLTPSQAQG